MDEKEGTSQLYNKLQNDYWVDSQQRANLYFKWKEEMRENGGKIESNITEALRGNGRILHLQERIPTNSTFQFYWRTAILRCIKDMQGYEDDWELRTFTEDYLTESVYKDDKWSVYAEEFEVRKGYPYDDEVKLEIRRKADE